MTYVASATDKLSVCRSVVGSLAWPGLQIVQDCFRTGACYGQLASLCHQLCICCIWYGSHSQLYAGGSFLRCATAPAAAQLQACLQPMKLQGLLSKTFTM